LFELPEGAKPLEVSELVGNQKVSVTLAFDGRQLRLIAQEPIVLEAGSVLKVDIKTGLILGKE